MAAGIPKTELYTARSFAAVTPSDSVGFDPCRALYIGSGGNVVVLGLDGSTAVTFTGVPTGTILPVQARRVNSTSTTASAIVALY